MGIKKEKPAALSLVKTPFINSLQNVMDQGNLLISVLEAARNHGGFANEKVGKMVDERLKAFREAMYGGEE